MYIIIWEYIVKAKQAGVFEAIYSAEGAWAKLFQKSKGYLKTDFLHDANHPHRYITIDRWVSMQEYKAFLSQWKNEYAGLDVQCEGLTVHESILGNFETISDETR